MLTKTFLVTRPEGVSKLCPGVAFDMPFHVRFLTKLFVAELALKGLESSVYRVDVGLEVICPSKFLLTLTALVELEFLVNRLDVFVKIPFLSECLATG